MKNNKKFKIITTTSLIFTMTATMARKPTLVFADEGFATAGEFTPGEIEEGEGTLVTPEQPADPAVPETPVDPTPAVPTTPTEPETPVAPTPTPEPEQPVTPVNPSQHQGDNETTGFTINYVDESGNHIYDSVHSTETNPEPKEIFGYRFKEKVESANEVSFVYSVVKYHSTRWEDTDGNVLQPYTIAEQISPQGEFDGYHFDHKEVDDNGNVLYIFAKNADENVSAKKHVEIETGVRGNLLLSFVTTIASLLAAGYLLVKKSTKY